MINFTIIEILNGTSNVCLKKTSAGLQRYSYFYDKYKCVLELLNVVSDFD